MGQCKIRCSNWHPCSPESAAALAAQCLDDEYTYQGHEEPMEDGFGYRWDTHHLPEPAVADHKYAAMTPRANVPDRHSPRDAASSYMQQPQKEQNEEQRCGQVVLWLGFLLFAVLLSLVFILPAVLPHTTTSTTTSTTPLTTSTSTSTSSRSSTATTTTATTPAAWGAAGDGDGGDDGGDEPHEDLLVTFKVKHLDYSSLLAKPALLGSVRALLQAAIAHSVGQVRPRDVLVSLQAGSVVVTALLPRVPRAAAARAGKELKASHALGGDVAERLSSVRGIAAAQTGPLEVVDLVAGPLQPPGGPPAVAWWVLLVGGLFVLAVGLTLLARFCFSSWQQKQATRTEGVPEGGFLDSEEMLEREDSFPAQPGDARALRVAARGPPSRSGSQLPGGEQPGARRHSMASQLSVGQQSATSSRTSHEQAGARPQLSPRKAASVRQVLGGGVQSAPTAAAPKTGGAAPHVADDDMSFASPENTGLSQESRGGGGASF